MTVSKILTDLKKQYGSDNYETAAAFIGLYLKALKLRKNTKLYAAAIEYFIPIIAEGKKNILPKRDFEQLQKDEAKGIVGRVHRELKKEFESLVNLYSIVKDSSKPDAKIETETKLPDPSPSAPKIGRRPEVKLESNFDRVPKNGTVTLTWSTKNAVKIKTTNIPGLKRGSTEVNGSIEVENVRRKRDFYLVVEGSDGQTAESRKTTLVETQEFLQGRERTSISRTPRQRTPQSQRTATQPQETVEEEQQQQSPQFRGLALSENLLVSIDKSLSGIVKILKDQLKFNEDFLNRQRIRSERERREGREEAMEAQEESPSGIQMMMQGAEKMLSPFQQVIQKIVDFVTYTFLGRAFTTFLDWFSDPENKDKVDAMGRFLKDFWPVIAAAAVWFLTPFGGFVMGTIKFLKGFIAISKSLVPKLLTVAKGIIAGPIGKMALVAGTVFALKEATDFDKEKQHYSNLSREKLLEERDKYKNLLEQPREYYQGEGMDRTNYRRSLGFIEEEIKNRQYSSGGSITPFSGEVTENDGKKVFGLGKDTQAFPVMGGGIAVLQPGETVLQPGVREEIKKEKGFDILSYNKGPNANQPKTMNSNISMMNTGGVVGTSKAPEITKIDYNTLLAISALEADDPQGRADVAQSIYNRLHVSNRYGINFLQKSNTIRDLIVAPNQYEPTFGNRQDWLNIQDDINSAATAVMNSSKGRRSGWTMEDAMRQIRDTEKALRDESKQKRSQTFVGGLPSFRGVSEHDFMKPDKGDVLRDNRSNFFTSADIENLPNYQQMVASPAPIPRMLLAQPQVQQQRPQTQQPPQNPIMSLLGNVKSGIQSGIQNVKSGIRGLLQRREGGLVSADTGMNLPCRASDGILARVECGEYVVPRTAVAKIGTDILDRVSALDPHSKAANTISRLDMEYPMPRPLSPLDTNISMETLPPINGDGGMAGGGLAIGNEIPPFPTTTAEDVRSQNAALYGIG